MDELTCPECGRPNLIEAEKCWYCQAALAHGDKNEVTLENGERNLAKSNGSENPLADQPVQEEDIPEWLKRIRELKKADQPVEEVNQWQQDKLFTGLAQDSEGSQEPAKPTFRPAKASETPAPRPIVPEGQPTLEEALTEEAIQDEDEESIKQNDAENELPEGFIPL